MLRHGVAQETAENGFFQTSGASNLGEGRFFVDGKTGSDVEACVCLHAE